MELSDDQEKDIRSTPGSLGYNSSLPLRDSSETLDHHHHLRHPQSSLVHGRRSDPDQFFGTADRIDPKSSGSTFKPPSQPSARYGECLKNHAATIGGNVLDGCGEFMPSGDDGTLEALKCAACSCHRNFHRKKFPGDSDFSRSLVHPLQLPPPLPSPSLKHHQKMSMGMGMGMHTNHHWPSMPQPVKMAFGDPGSAATDSSSEELNFEAFQSNAVAAQAPPPLSKKRFRTKFTQEQKEKMLEFAEKVAWRIPKEDDAEVQRFCGEVGVKRQVFKVWMHNNKNTMQKQHNQQQQEQHDHEQS